MQVATPFNYEWEASNLSYFYEKENYSVKQDVL